MKRRPPLPYLCLLPLVAILLFGNCNGGVNRFLYNLERTNHLVRLDSLLRERQVLRLQARKLHGQPRRDQLRSIERRTNEQTQLLLSSEWQRQKLARRRPKIERRLRQGTPLKRPWFVPQ
ncbi:hypothetical protein [Hymenobacter ruber]